MRVPVSFGHNISPHISGCLDMPCNCCTIDNEVDVVSHLRRLPTILPYEERSTTAVFQVVEFAYVMEARCKCTTKTGRSQRNNAKRRPQIYRMEADIHLLSTICIYASTTSRKWLLRRGRQVDVGTYCISGRIYAPSRQGSRTNSAPK